MDTKENIIYRKEQCPWGKKAVSVLKNENIDYSDHIFSSKKEEEEFKLKYDVKTTPQIFINGKRIGGYTDLAEYYKKDIDEEKSSYTPVFALFAVATSIALASKSGMMGFMGYSLCLLSLLKLMDLKSFVSSFKKYDIITKKVNVYGYAYPFAELVSGLGFISGTLPIVAGSLALFVGLTGGISIFKAVYIDKTDLNCACIGGNTKVPLGIISFSENAMMTIMGALLIYQTL